jgi:hypothetical protein
MLSLLEEMELDLCIFHERAEYPSRGLHTSHSLPEAKLHGSSIRIKDSGQAYIHWKHEHFCFSTTKCQESIHDAHAGTSLYVALK